MDIILSENSEYTHYETLLLERDELLKQCGKMRTLYLHEFGEFLVRNYEKRIQCIQKKKIIGYMQTYINRGTEPDYDAICASLNHEMEEYSRKLEKLRDESDACRKLHRVPEHIALDVKKLYRELAKRLHPDVNPETNSRPELLDLWTRIVSAYYHNDKEELEDLKIMALKELRDAGIGETELNFPNLAERIKKLNEEIQSIITTDPYLYHEILDSELKTEQKIAGLREEYETLQAYETELDSILQRFRRDE